MIAFRTFLPRLTLKFRNLLAQAAVLVVITSQKEDIDYYFISLCQIQDYT